MEKENLAFIGRMRQIYILRLRIFAAVEFFAGDIFEFGSVALKTKEAKETHLALLHRAMQKNVIVCFDPNVRLNLWEDANELKQVIWEYPQYTDIVKVSEDELKFLTDCEHIEQAVTKLWNAHLKLVVIVTKGEQGATLYLKNQKCFFSFRLSCSSCGYYRSRRFLLWWIYFRIA